MCERRLVEDGIERERRQQRLVWEGHQRVDSSAEKVRCRTRHGRQQAHRAAPLVRESLERENDT